MIEEDLEPESSEPDPEVEAWKGLLSDWTQEPKPKKLYNEARFKQFVSRLSIVNAKGAYQDLCPLFPEQEQIISTFLTGQSMLILKPRQIGSSTAILSCAFAVCFFAVTPLSFLILSHKASSSKYLLNKIRLMYNALPEDVRRQNPAKITVNDIVFTNSGAAISARGAQEDGGLRSFSATHLLISEFNEAEEPEELLATALAALNTGQLIIESTATYFGDALHTQIQKNLKGETDHKFLFFPWSQHPTYRTEPPAEFKFTVEDQEYQKLYSIDDAQLYWRRQQIGKYGIEHFQREFPLTMEEAYSQTSGAFISQEQLQYLKKHDHTPAHRLCTHEPIKDAGATKYIIGADVGMGIGRDFSTLIVLDAKNLEVVASYRSNTIPTVRFAELIKTVSDTYHNAKIVVESNAIGLAVWNDLIRAGANLWTDTKGKPWTTTTQSRPLLLEEIRKHIVNQTLKSVDYQTHMELRAAQMDAYGRIDVSREVGSHGDNMIALGLALMGIRGMNFRNNQLSALDEHLRRLREKQTSLTAYRRY